MVFFRYPRRRFMKRKSYTRRKPMRRIFKRVRRLERAVETKYFSTTSVVEVNSDAINTVDLTAIATGDTNATRTGNKITARSIHIRGHVSLPIGGITSIFRYVIVQDRQQVGDTSPSWTDIFTSADVDSLVNSTTAGRFKIIRDRVIVLQPPDSSGGSGLTAVIKPINVYVKLRKPIQVRYNNTAGTDVQKNGIYFLAISDILAANVGPVTDLNLRLGFTDM